MKPRNKIEFAPAPVNGQQSAPWEYKPATIYEDLIFKNEFADRKLKLEAGPNWLRIVPALMTSKHWMLHVPAVSMKHGRFAHPRTFQRGGQCVFDRAYRWFAANEPDKLYNRANPSGHRLLCDSLCAFWCLQETKAGAVEARLFIGSSFQGSRKNQAGLGFRIWQHLTERDDDVDVVSDPMHPNHGTMICIEKSEPGASRTPVYQIRVGRRSSPIQELLDRMEPSEFDALCPIEDTIRELSDEEQWEHLVRVIGEEAAARIRDAGT